MVVNEMEEMDIGEEVMESVRGSLKYVWVITEGLCWEPDKEEEEEDEPEVPCVDPPTEENRVCDITGSNVCIMGIQGAMEWIHEANKDGATDEVIDTACR